MYRRSALRYLTSAPLGLAICEYAVAAKIVDPAWLIEGAWLVSLEGESRDRFLTLSGVKLNGDRLEVENASYGYIDGSAKPVREWQANVEGDTIKIQFLTPADSQISVVLNADEAAVLGQFRSKKGKQVPVRLTKLPASELAELRQASQASARPMSSVIRNNSRIVLLYVSASDCPACRGYEAEYFGRKNLMAIRLPEFSEIIYHKAFLGSYHAASSVASVLPPELAPLALRGPNGEPSKIRCHGTPYFALIVDEKVIVQAHGITGLETLVIPQIKRVVALRRQVT
ncbi:MAG: hypothetical protein Q7T78_20715 [Rhodoferax sp.]|nr:hypothetical protein [Rhodoferax sp.]